jgi:hypothetical protein
MRRRLTVALLAMLLPAGCGGQHSQRPALANYITQAGRIEAALVTPLTAVTQAGAGFAKARGRHARLVDRLSGAGSERILLLASTQIGSLRARLAALPAPPPATRLRRLLLERVDLQARLTREVAALVAFVPRFAATLGPLGPATRRLEVSLSQRSAYGAAAVAAAYATKAAALRRFQASVDAVLVRLRGLRPPAVSRPGYRAQVASLVGMSTTAGRLARSIAAGPQGDVQPLLAAFDRAALSTQSVAVQKAQIAAIRSYDAQSGRLDGLTQAIDDERVRLSNTLR